MSVRFVDAVRRKRVLPNGFHTIPIETGEKRDWRQLLFQSTLRHARGRRRNEGIGNFFGNLRDSTILSSA